MKQLPSSKLPQIPLPKLSQDPWWKRVPKPSPKQIGYMALAIVTGILLVWAFRPAPVWVTVGKVDRGSLQVTIDAEGKTRVRDRYGVAAPVNGHLNRIQLEEGDIVQRGSLVAQIDPLPLTAAVKQALGQLAEWKAQRSGVATQRPKPATLAQAQTRIQTAEANYRQAQAKVVQAQAALTQAQRDRDRAEQLAVTGAISRNDREAAELKATTQAQDLEALKLAAQAAATEVQIARDAVTVLQQEQTDPDYLLRVYDARIASTEAEFAKLQDDADRTEIRSPVQGQVLRIFQKSAQFVSEGTPLLEIGNLAQLELVIDVLSSDAERIQTGNPILIEQLNASPIRAKVRRIEPAAFTKVSALGVEEQRVNVIGDFVDRPVSLGDAYRVDTKIVVWHFQNVLKVPLSALFRCDQGWCVFTVKDDRTQRRSVEVAHRSDLEAEITQGLIAGEVVILHPNETISQNQRVRTR